MPAIIIFHAGGYSECGSYDNPGIVTLGNDLAARGFVVFNVNYRLGVSVDLRLVAGTNPNDELTYTCATQCLSIYRALQDARGAIRSVIKMQRDGVNQNLYQIDEDKIFLAGASAGSLLALCSEYFGSQNKINSIFPGIGASLGNIDRVNVYYANPVDVNYFGKIKGILNCWGSLFVPKSFEATPYDFFSDQGYDLPPIISFHGKEDKTFNYISQRGYFSPPGINPFGNPYDVESRCLPPDNPYTVPPQNANGTRYKFVSLGSQTIYDMLKSNNIATEYYLDCQMAHGLDTDDPLCGTCTSNPDPFKKPRAIGIGCITCGYQSNFGTNANNTDLTYDYIAARAATFFQAILGGVAAANPASVTAKFVECENFRVKCSGTETTCQTEECQ